MPGVQLIGVCYATAGTLFCLVASTVVAAFVTFLYMCLLRDSDFKDHTLTSLDPLCCN